MSLLAPELTYDVTSWHPGFLDSPDPAALPKGGTAEAANAFLTAITPEGRCKLAKRQGARLLNPSAISLGDRIDALYDFRQEGGSGGTLLAVCNGHLTAFDGDDTFDDIADLELAPGSLVTFMTFRNVVHILNGTVQQFYDGDDVFDVGFAAPTAAPGLAAVTPAAGGLTGDYQSLATWYDSVHDHESSPTAFTAAVTFAAKDRRHTKPAGSPPDQVDKWRVYVRRSDTSETYFKLVAEVAIATGTATEAVPDVQRNLATNLLAPLPNANDVPPVFAFAATALGYRFGVQTDDSFVWVSALSDPQSQHPKDKFGVSRGDGRAITTIKAVGTMVVVQKATQSWYLDGDRMPFVPKELKGSFGNVSQASSVEADSRYWAWDADRGPYVTDLAGSWRSLVDGRIAGVLATVDRTAPIACAHDKAHTLVVWIVATDATARTRTLLAYHYLLDAWLPPITGIDYASIVGYQAGSAPEALYVGDAWGRVFEYFVGDVEGVPSGTLTGTPTGGATDSVTVAGATFYTDGDGLAGLPVALVDAAGVWQTRRVASNTADTITIDTDVDDAWPRAPLDTDTVVVGGIDWFWRTPLIVFDAPLRRKRGGYVYAELRSDALAAAAVQVRVRLADTSGPVAIDGRFGLSQANVWGTAQWGGFTWGATTKQPLRRRVLRSFYGLQIEVRNGYPNQPIELVTLGVTADGLKGRWAHG